MSFNDNTFIKAEGIYYQGVLNEVRKHKNPLQPIYEAFTNALEAINLRKDKADNGSITIRLFFYKDLIGEPQFHEVSIEDTGVGFNDDEFRRFTTYKDNRKGFKNKGSGRLQLIHYFQNCNFVSIYKEGDNYKERKFKLSKAKEFLQENAVIFLESTKLTTANSPSTILSLSRLHNDKESLQYIMSPILLKEYLITHYIQYFCSHREQLPKINLCSYLDKELLEETAINSDDIPEVNETSIFTLNYNKLSSDGKNIIKSDNLEEFTIKAFRIPKEKLEKNSIRLTSKDEIVESNDFKINLHSLSADDFIGNDRFLFLISSPYIDKNDDDRRGDLKIIKKENFKKEIGLFDEEEIFLDDIEDAANTKIVSMYYEIKQKNEEKKVEIEVLKNMFLLNEGVLNNISISLNDSEEKILEKVYAAESKLIAKGDYEIKKQIEDLNSLNPSSENYEEEFNEAIKKLVKEIPLQNRTALTHYVARRKLVLEIFEKVLHKKLDTQKSSKRNLDERLLHNIIFKQNSKSPDASDLWLVNEDFMLFKGVSENKLKDIELDGVKVLKEELSDEEINYRDSLNENRYGKRPDILLFPNEGKCIIVELKSPDVNVSEHINQINRYASLILNLSKQEFGFDTFYGYLIGEAIDGDDIRDFDADFKHAPHFDYLFRPAKTLAGKFGRQDGSLYTEIIKYSTLYERAKDRNEIFINKLINPASEDDELDDEFFPF